MFGFAEGELEPGVYACEYVGGGASAFEVSGGG